MKSRYLIDNMVRRPQGGAILPIGAVNLKTGKNQLFGEIWFGWDEGKGSNILVNRRDGTPIVVHTSGEDLESLKKQYPVGSVLQFYHDQTMRQLDPGTVIDVFPHTKAGLDEIKSKTGKSSVKFYTFK